MNQVPPERALEHQRGLPVEPSARTYTLAELVRLVREGHVRVPHFQRGLRWTKSDAVALIDSVLRGFPIGSLLLWKRPGPADTFPLGDVSITAPELAEALYVVDGQQRITAFLNAFDPEAGINGEFALVYDLKERPFKVRAKRPNESGSIPLPVLFDLSSLLRWTRENPQYLDSIDEINEATTRLREFHVPAYEVRSDDDRALRDIYDRMNNAGKRLSRAEAFWGLFAPDEDAIGELMSLSDLQDHVAQALHWGLIDDDTILRVFLARRGHDVTRDIHQEFSRERRPNSDFPGESEQEAYQRALEALEKTIIFLRDSAGVPHFTFLAFRYLLIVLSRFFALYPNPSPRNIELLKRWYWRAALAGPSIARGSATGAVRTLASCIHLGDESGSVQNLLAAVRDKPTPVPDVSNFRSNYATGHIMLCALWHLAPRSPDTKKPFSYRDLAEQIGEESTPNVVCVPLFARSQVPLELRSSLGNRMILPGVPREAISPMLEDCLSDTGSLRGYADVAKSHRLDIDVISSDMGNRAGDVVGQREADLQVSISEFLMHMTGEGLDDSAPLDVFNFDDEDDDMHEVSEPESDEGFLW